MQGARLNRVAAIHALILTLAITFTPGIFPVHAADEGAASAPPPVDAGRGGDDAERPSITDRLSLGGYLKNETAFRVREPRSVTKIRNIAQLNGVYAFTPDYQLAFSGWAYHDLAYDLFDYQTISARFARDDDQPLVFIDSLQEQKDSPVAEIRELYLDMYHDRLDVRIGRQFVVWGVLEGVRITDEINPFDFRELILPDLMDYRIPLWTLKLDYYGDDSDYQFLWIPDLRFHKPAPPGSEWELLQDITDPDGNLITRYPARNLRNSEVGFKASTAIGDAAVSFSYFYTWDDFPVLFRSAQIDSALEPAFFPTFTRINMYGTTFVKPVGRGVIKAEAAFVPDKYFGLRNDTDRDGDGFLDSQGVLQKRHIRWGLGYDFSRWGYDFSPAITQWIILDHDSQLIQDQFDTSLTLFARKPIPRYSAVFQVLVIGLVNMQELYIKPKITLQVSDHFQVATGVDLFFGDRSQLGVAGGSPLTGTNAIEQNAQFFGNFSGNDRIFVEARYTF